MEGKEGVDVAPDAEEIKPDAEGKHPETVPWNRYVGIKESFGKKLSVSEDKVKSLEEQLKNAPNAEEFTRIKSELDSTKTKLQTIEGELTKQKEKSVSELRATLKGKGISDEKVAKMSETEMQMVLEVLGDTKPLPDMGSGGGSGELRGSPQELAVRAYEQPAGRK